MERKIAKRTVWAATLAVVFICIAGCYPYRYRDYRDRYENWRYDRDYGDRDYDRRRYRDWDRRS
jgi:hypothetical protein